MAIDSDAILDILGNDTRRRILGVLANEPMYFNQLAKEVEVGQQAMLRHLDALEKGGLVETYVEKSNFGAPNRKYYKLSSAFSLTVSLSEDDFLITHQKIAELPSKDSKRIYKKLDSMPEDTGEAVSILQESLAKVDAGISDLELQLSDLRALRQNILRRLHEIGAEKFEDDERKVLYMVVRESPETVAELSELLDEKESVLKTVITRMKIKMQNESDLADLFEKF